MTPSGSTGRASAESPRETSPSFSLRKELETKYPGRKIEISQERRSADVTIERGWGLNPTTWPRFAAKVALCALAEVMPDGWRDSDGELFLLALFRKGLVIGAPNGISAVPAELTAGDPLYDLLAPREHLIVVMPREGAVAVQLVLFGELRYTLGIKTEILPASGNAWVCDPTEKHVTRFDRIDALFGTLFERQLLFGPTIDLRTERPHARLIGPTALARMQETAFPSGDAPSG